MIVIRNGELKKVSDYTGVKVRCPHCGKNHMIRYADETLMDRTKKPSKVIGFVRCKGKPYMVSFMGKLMAELVEIRKRRDKK